MSISKTLVVNINKDRAKAQDKMYIYKNDVGVDIYIELSNLNYNFDGIRNDFKFANALFKTPSDVIHTVNGLSISNKRIKFSFTRDIIELMQEVGSYELQFQVFDKDKNRLTIPPYYFEVKEPLGNTELQFDLAVADYARADYSYVGEEDEFLFAIEDGYIKTTWNIGDLITSSKLNNMENGISLALEQSSAEIDLTYTSDRPSTVEIGGLPKGYTSDGISLVQLIDDMLHPYASPSISLSMSPSTTLYELGYVVSSIKLTTKTTVGSEKISKTTLLKGSTIISESTNGDITLDVKNINSNTTFKASVYDGKKTVNSNSLSVSFVDPIYIGSLSGITANNIKSMTKKVVNPSNQSFTYNINNKMMCIAFPSNWNLKNIIDPNGFDITSSFISQTINLYCLDGTNKTYTVYYSNLTSQNNFTVKFNF